jgi:very-short-patch-repair endonuclease
MRPQSRIAVIAARQCGVVTRRQLRDAGIGPEAIKRRIRGGLLHPVHRGVYLVGHPVPPAGAREMAAVLACGPNAYVSHTAAAFLHELLSHPAQPAPVHVTVAERDCGRRPGIEVHRVQHLPPDEIGRLDGIPLTSPARTLIDLSATSHAGLEQALAEAQVRRLVTAVQLLQRAEGRSGAKRLRRLVGSQHGPALTRSEAERRMLTLIRKAALPSPKTNAQLNGYEVDFLWSESKLVVEVDGFAFHSTRAAFERDRARDAALVAAGYAVVRVTWRQLVEQPEAVVARVAAAIATR